jgi:thioredoxin reductase/NAD-dependent dihydropyrimidine dehydrogenase PreA subunit
MLSEVMWSTLRWQSALLTWTSRQWGMAAAAAFGALALAYLLRRAVRERSARLRLEEAVRLELDVPTSLHPVIDPDVCIGSGACLSACPEGDILGIVGGVAKLINASSCIGHGRCAAECPVDAIKLVFGTAKRGVDLPELDGNFETSRPGVFVVGELAGMGLIKNALIQGLQVAAHIARTLPLPVDEETRRTTFDIVIVGAGPAGIAAAVGARAAGMTFAVIEQETMGGTIAHYPRQKLVMTAPVHLPYYGAFGRRYMSKEQLVEAFDEVTERAGVKVHEQVKVTAIDGGQDDFAVSTSKGELRARRIVLAIGRRGTPRPLGVPGEGGANVAYRLIDPEQYQGRRVLVVGGGDSALEAAIALAETTATVSICYRRPEFGRCRPLNKQKMDALLASGKVRAFMGTDVVSVGPDAVELTKDGAPTTLPNDFVIACLGGELPIQFLEGVGVGIRRHDGKKAMPNPTLAGRARPDGRGAAMTLAVLGIAILVALAYVGFDYYRLPRPLRFESPAHTLLKPSGAWGHGLGILATFVMLSNFVYSVRKRLLKRWGSMAAWLRFHTFVGLMSPLTILFHSAFQWGNQLATATYVSLVVVMVTGLIGRYIYGWLRLAPDHAEQVSTLGERVQRTVERLARSAQAPSFGDLAPLFAAAPVGAGTGASLFLGRPRDEWRVRRGVRRTRGLFLDRGAYLHFRGESLRLHRLRIKEAFHDRYRPLMKAWRMFHVTLAVLLLGLIGLHVWISIRVGFKWLWT